MVILNLGCGTRTSSATVNIDWSLFLRVRRSRLAPFVAPFLFRGQRRERFDALDENIVVHDLRDGVPAADDSVDAVYHSHVLEHIDRGAVPGFMTEIRRVLKPGGIHRIVVPDLEQLARSYMDDLEAGKPSPGDHDVRVERMIGQMVRREAYGTSLQRPLRRRIENAILGDARRRGETHQWMWDRVNLTNVLTEAGFHDVRLVDWRTSAIRGWDEIALDIEGGREYKPGSLYVEARK